MLEIYSYCTVCDKELIEVDQKLNIENDNYNYPICVECLEEAKKEIIYGLTEK